MYNVQLTEKEVKDIGFERYHNKSKLAKLSIPSIFIFMLISLAFTDINPKIFVFGDTDGISVLTFIWLLISVICLALAYIYWIKKGIKAGNEFLEGVKTNVNMPEDR